MSVDRPLRVFCSYAHEDEEGIDILRANLSALRRNNLIDDWHDRQIPPGAFWDEEIRKQLDAADIILLLISADFINSDYCMNLEVKRAYERAREGSATVIPIFYRDCHTKDQPFADGQGTPKDMKWIGSQDNQDAAWTEVTKFIDRAVTNRRALADLPNAPEPIQTFFSDQSDTASDDALEEQDKTGLKWAYTALGFVALMAVSVTWFWFAPFDAKSVSAKTLLLQGDYPSARDECNAAPPSAFKTECLEITSLALDPFEPQVRQTRLKAMGSVYSELMLAEMDINKQNFIAAESRYQELAKQHPNIPQVEFGLGRVLHMLNKPKEALKHYRLAIGGDKEVQEQLENSGISLSIAGALADAGQLEEAKEAYTSLLNKDKSVMFAHIQLVRVLSLLGEQTEAQNRVMAAQDFFENVGSKVLISKLHNIQPWWYMGDDNKPVILNNWKTEKNPYMKAIFGSVF